MRDSTSSYRSGVRTAALGVGARVGVVLATTAVLVTAGCGGAPPKRKASAMNFVPSEIIGVGRVYVSKLVTEDVIKDIIGAAKDSPDIASGLTQAGIDIERDVKKVVFFLCRDGGGEPYGAAIAEGKFDAEKIYAALN